MIRPPNEKNRDEGADIMHPTLTDLRSKLSNMTAWINTNISSPEPFGIALGNWSFPCLTKFDLMQKAQDLIDIIDVTSVCDIGNSEGILKDYSRRLDFLQANTLPNLWGPNCGPAVSAYEITIAGLKHTFAEAFRTDVKRETAKALAQIQLGARAMEARLKDLARFIHQGSPEWLAGVA